MSSSSTSPLPELLAPAGSFEALRAAVENGADAVYLGGRQFHARGRAVNFDGDELARAIEYAHVKNVSVYVTVNTLLANGEFRELAPYLSELASLGADAVIVQDLGVMKFVREHYPELPVHVSTQACIQSSHALSLLESLGVERVILPRELTLAEIRLLRERTRLPLETFVHGALCYSYSGQCLSSSLIGGRSGNRGQCASTCRLPYDLLKHPGALALGAFQKEDPHDMSAWDWQTVPTEGMHLESSRDLCTIELVPKLIEAGVSSFKIEGRMKRPEYVATAVRAYRTALDRYAKGNFHITPQERRELEQAFNRQFTTAYLVDSPGNAFVSPDRSENRGVRVGTVTGFRQDRMLVRLEETLSVGDGIEVWTQQGGGFGQRVERIELRGHPVPRGQAGETVSVPKQGFVNAGDPVYRTLSRELQEKSRASYEGAGRRVSVEVRCAPSPDASSLHVEIRDGDASGAATVPLAPARSTPLSERAVKDQLGKLGDTPLKARNFDVTVPPGAFAPLGELNRARREAVQAFLSAKAAARKRAPAQALDPSSFLSLPERPRVAPTVSVVVSNLRALDAALAGGADDVYFPPLEWGGDKDDWNLDWVARALESTRKAGARLWLHLPYITREADMAYAERTLPALAARGPAGVVAGNLGALALASRLGLPARADYFVNAFNSYTIRVLSEFGAEGVTLSPELTLGQMAEVARTAALPVEAVVHGQLHLMISEHCIIGAAEGCYGPQGKHVPCRRETYAIRDQAGYVFPLLTDGKCRMHMMNSRELAMVDRVPELLAAGIERLRIDAQMLHPGNVEAVVRAYKDALAGCANGTFDGPSLLARVEKARTLPLTTAHFYRPVL
ncbi:MAG TPA: U32 family peptidase [Candidatus Thermoplasmatota archaeon]|nr:U32 family peptidase [Candidatus Thermoplasmatota archaeon]